MIFSAVRTYKIQIHGRIEAADISATSPVPFVIEPVNEARSNLIAQADQSGVIGLIRHLHGLGLVILSLSCNMDER